MKPRRILVVDDLRDTAGSFAYLLAQMGHVVEFTTNPEAALGIARRLLPEFGFIDIGMPRVDGWQLAGLLKAQEGLGHLRLFAISGYDSAAHRARSRDAGFEQHLAKPVVVSLVEDILVGKTATSPSPRRDKSLKILEK